MWRQTCWRGRIFPTGVEKKYWMGKGVVWEKETWPLPWDVDTDVWVMQNNSLSHIHKNCSNSWHCLSMLLENHLGLCFLWGEEIHRAGTRDLSPGCLTLPSPSPLPESEKGRRGKALGWGQRAWAQILTFSFALISLSNSQNLSKLSCLHL